MFGKAGFNLRRFLFGFSHKNVEDSSREGDDG